jgi:hypothetical protein
MKLSLDARRNWLVIAVFGGLISVTLVVGYLRGLWPSEAEACVTQCKIRDLEGHMVYVLPWTTTAGMRGKGPEECKCFRPGTYNPLTQ